MLPVLPTSIKCELAVNVNSHDKLGLTFSHTEFTRGFKFFPRDSILNEEDDKCYCVILDIFEVDEKQEDVDRMEPPT